MLYFDNIYIFSPYTVASQNTKVGPIHPTCMAGEAYPKLHHLKASVHQEMVLIVKGVQH